MIIIDTNVLYYATEVSSNNQINIEKLRTFIDKEPVMISSVSLYEFVMKYRDNANVLQKIEQYLDENKFKIAFNKYFPIFNGFETHLSKVADNEFNYIITEIKDKKVYVESCFTAIVFDMCFFSGAYFAGVKGEDVSELVFTIITQAVNLVSIGSFDAVKKIYEEGYETTDCENKVRKGFNELLGFFFQVFIPFIEEAASIDDEVAIKDFIEDIDWEKLSRKLNNKIKKNATSLAYLNKIAKKYWKESNDDHLEIFIKNFDNTIKKIPESALQEYLKEIIANCCISGGSFQKNDILDAIILCNVCKGDKMITFDKGVINHMKKYSCVRKEYADSLEIISEFYK